MLKKNKALSAQCMGVVKKGNQTVCKSKINDLKKKKAVSDKQFKLIECGRERWHTNIAQIQICCSMSQRGWEKNKKVKDAFRMTTGKHRK